MKTSQLSRRNAYLSLAVITVCGVLSLFANSAGAATKQLATAKNDIPRLTDGRPDFNGVWANDEMGFVNPQRDVNGSVLCIVGCPQKAAAAEGAEAAPATVQPPGGAARPKYKPEFAAKVMDLNNRQVALDPALKCGNPGLPRIGPPDAIVQRPGQIVFLYEDLSGSFFRMIPTDGRAHRADAEETYLGDSVGKWEGDTLVVEAVKFIDETWLTDNGAFHTSGLKVIERLRRVGNQLEYLAVAEDPAVLAEPWQLRTRVLKQSDEPLHEPLPCVEKDLDHVVDGSHHGNPR